MLGELFAVVLYVARMNVISPFDILLNTPATELADWILADLQFVDLIFWIAAIGGAAYFVKRRLSHEEGLAIYMCEMRY